MQCETYVQGNQCRQFLKKAENLEVMLVEVGGDPMDIGLKYTRAIKFFDKVVSLCFGNTLKPGHEEAISDFKSSYLDLGITVTPKVY